MTLPVLDLSGTPRARGRAHGEALRERVHAHLARWFDSLAEDVGDPRAYLERFLAGTNFLPAARRETPDLLDELEGIAEGSGAPFAQVLGRALSDEEPWFRREVLLGDGGAKGCSSVGANARDGAPPIVAQNMDVPSWWRGTEAVLRITEPDGLRIVVFTVAGKISLCGMNSAGLAIACNTLAQLDYSRIGLAEDFVVRGYLAQRTQAAGVAFLRRVAHASGQNYTVPAGDGTVLNLECSARSVVAWRPWEDADRVFHTNHPIANPDTGLYERLSAGLDAAGITRWFSGTSQARFAALRAHLGDPAWPATEETVRAALASREGPVSRVGEIEGKRDGYTIASVVMRCGAQPSLSIAPGPPHLTPYQDIKV